MLVSLGILLCSSYVCLDPRSVCFWIHFVWRRVIYKYIYLCQRRLLGFCCAHHMIVLTPRSVCLDCTHPLRVAKNAQHHKWSCCWTIKGVLSSLFFFYLPPHHRIQKFRLPLCFTQHLSTAIPLLISICFELATIFNNVGSSSYYPKVVIVLQRWRSLLVSLG